MRHAALLLVGILAAAAACSDGSLAPTAPDGGSGGRGGSQIGEGGGGEATAGEAQAGETTGQGGAGVEPGAAGMSATQGGAPASTCNQGKGATLSGRIFAPNGELPLPGVSVYVPSSTVDALPNGASCWLCDSQLFGSPIALATTDAEGRFELVNAPVGKHVPVVVQTGKWRRQLEVDSIVDCEDHPLSEADTRLPGRQSEGNVPRIALVSGGEDTLECLLRKLGVADSEFVAQFGAGRVQLFSGKGGMTELDGGPSGAAGAGADDLTAARELWSSSETLGVFDLVLLGSESDESAADKPPAARDLLRDYAAAGGRVLLQHFQSYFLEMGPADLAALATFNAQPDLSDPFSAKVDVSSARGKALADWLTALEPNATSGELSVELGQNRTQAVNAPALRLLYGTAPATVQAFSVDLPYGAGASSCGRITATDLLTAAGDSALPFPAGCQSEGLSPQEQALAFLIFDLGACL